MPKNSARETLRIERLHRVHLLAGADEFDRYAGDGADGKRRAAAGVAVHLGQDQAADAEGCVECLGDIDGFLAGHGIRDEQDLGRLDGALDIRHLGHHPLIDLQTAGGIDDDGAVAALLGELDRMLGDLDRICRGSFLENRNVDLPAEGLQLLDGGRPVDVGSHQERKPAFLSQKRRQFCSMCGLTGTLQARPA